VNEPQFVERESVQSVSVGENEMLLMPGVVPRLMRTPGTIAHVGRSIGADTDVILADLLGASPEALKEWREVGII